jgi:hypothetical protein
VYTQIHALWPTPAGNSFVIVTFKNLNFGLSKDDISSAVTAYMQHARHSCDFGLYKIGKMVVGKATSALMIVYVKRACHCETLDMCPFRKGPSELILSKIYIPRTNR